MPRHISRLGLFERRLHSYYGGARLLVPVHHRAPILIDRISRVGDEPAGNVKALDRRQTQPGRKRDDYLSPGRKCRPRPGLTTALPSGRSLRWPWLVCSGSIRQSLRQRVAGPRMTTLWPQLDRGGQIMDWDDYFRQQAVMYRQLAEKTEDTFGKQELLELAAVCEEVANNIEDRRISG
jgi:hypothetical protein